MYTVDSDSKNHQTNSETITIYCDQSTGEVFDIYREPNFKKARSKVYYKVFMEDDIFPDRTPAATKVVFFSMGKFIPYTTQEPYFHLTERELESFSKSIGISVSTIRKSITFLLNCKLLIRVHNGVYFLNPYVIARGSPSTIAKNQSLWDSMV